ncbi:hypothetical protein [Bacillus sp. BP-3]|uniref:hypothetical protein n=1 Tax=Bacillus sp. BP-3 TaxID=3022773 RepID=UPI00232F713B|nr:hypothetical protein [Bacillus sp. BP-3]MDC2867344.1 hypothetical protein [Bacillus sp. BP-3]
MERWISIGMKISLGLYVLLGVLGIGYIIRSINNSGYEWTQNHTVDAITLFCVFYALMTLFVRGIMDKKLTKRTLLLDIPLVIIVAVGLIASMIFVEEQHISVLTSLMAFSMSLPIALLFLRIGYRQWRFYTELEELLEKGKQK